MKKASTNRAVSVFLALIMVVSMCNGLFLEAGAANIGTASAAIQGTYTQSSEPQEITVRITPEVSHSYCTFAIDGGTVLPNGFTIKSISTSNTDQPLNGGNYNLITGQISYDTDDAEDTISANTYYEIVLMAPANAAGSFSVTFRDVLIASSYGTAIDVDLASVTTTFVIEGTAVPTPSEPTLPPVTEEDQAGDDCARDNTCPLHDYADLVRHNWYHDGIHYCIENELMRGTGAKSFDPDSATTRAMIVTILWRLKGSPVMNYNMTFKDVASNGWYTEAVRWAQANAIVSGYDDKTFGPTDTITREQMATIMWRYAKYKGYDVSGGISISSYGDAATVSEWAVPAVQWACDAKLIQGIAKGSAMNLQPKGNATRAQAATILYRFCDNIAK